MRGGRSLGFAKGIFHILLIPVLFSFFHKFLETTTHQFLHFNLLFIFVFCSILVLMNVNGRYYVFCIFILYELLLLELEYC